MVLRYCSRSRLRLVYISCWASACACARSSQDDDSRSLGANIVRQSVAKESLSYLDQVPAFKVVTMSFVKSVTRYSVFIGWLMFEESVVRRKSLLSSTASVPYHAAALMAIGDLLISSWLAPKRRCELWEPLLQPDSPRPTK